MLLGIGVIFAGVAIFIYRITRIPEQIIEHAQAQHEQAESQAAATQDRGSALREVALHRMKTGYIPDPDTAFERQIAIDGMAIALQAAGLTMPDSLRQLLDYLTLDELRDALAD